MICNCSKAVCKYIRCLDSCDVSDSSDTRQEQTFVTVFFYQQNVFPKPASHLPHPGPHIPQRQLAAGGSAEGCNIYPLNTDDNQYRAVL